MVMVKLPDGKELHVGDGATVLDVAKQVGPGLAKAAIAGKVDGLFVDLNRTVGEGATVEIVTEKTEGSLDILRHSTAHVMAAAVKRLYGPNVKFAIGPAIEDGFYYDFDLEHRLVPEDLEKIETEMAKVLAEGKEFERSEIDRARAIADMKSAGQDYKVELLDDIADDRVSLYRVGDFVDLCRGPHLHAAGRIPAFKLTGIAGSYWRGDSRRKMLQRIYGTAFWSKKDLEKHIRMLEEARKRDHRRLGRELDLFSFHDEGPGFPFFHPKGMVVLNEMLAYWRRMHRREKYVETKTPIILNEALWHQSGHWDHYRDNMYFTQIDEQAYAVKPMNCPGNLLIYKANQHSYREFPIRAAELGLVHRHELSGVLHGLMRVRAFTQDDAHIFCLPEQLESEVKGVIRLVFEMYKRFGLEEVELELSTRPDHSIGTDAQWELATNALKRALESDGLPYRLHPGEGAFYGPKIDFHIKDSLGRRWQCGTIQADMAMPERFDLEYTGADGQKHRPVMVHRTVLGSIERFFGILIEHYAGALPFWLAPVQAIVIPVGDNFLEYARTIGKSIEEAGIRVEVDDRSETVGNKIRLAELQKVPYMLVVGQREVENATVSVRERGRGDTGAISVAEGVDKLKGLADKD